MDADRFDRLVTTLAAVGTRRALFRLGVAVPLAGTLLTRLEERVQGQGNGAIVGGGGGRRRRRKARHRHDPGNNKDNRKGKGKRNSQDPSTGPAPQPSCVPESPAQTCAGHCGSVTDNCGTVVACGGCDAFHICQANQCVDCGEPGDPCCAGNTCESNAFCSGGECIECGGAGGPCCPPGNTCRNGTCSDGECA